MYQGIKDNWILERVWNGKIESDSKLNNIPEKKGGSW